MFGCAWFRFRRCEARQCAVCSVEHAACSVAHATVLVLWHNLLLLLLGLLPNYAGERRLVFIHISIMTPPRAFVLWQGNRRQGFCATVWGTLVNQLGQ